MPSPVGPKPTVVITTPAPKQTIEASPVDPRQRYRRIRIQDALASSAKRADAMNELTWIELELAKRFGR